MSTTRFVEKAKTAKTADAAPAPGLLARIHNALMAARQRQADREIEHYLARQSDRMLRDIGMTDEDVSRLRERHGR